MAIPGIAPSCSFKYATAFAWLGWRTSREPNDASAFMWSTSFAISIRSSTAPIGRDVGAAVGVAEDDAGVAVALDDGAVPAGDGAEAGAAPPQAAPTAQTKSTMSARIAWTTVSARRP